MLINDFLVCFDAKIISFIFEGLMGLKMGIRKYAIVDIETTGAYAGGSCMTEIAVLVHDGTQVLEEYHSLINPGQPIPHHIQVLTGIDNAMVAEAPMFKEIAASIFELLRDKIFVAHNVSFDHSFIHKQLSDCGYFLKVPKLCTVRLSRKCFQGLPSYSLGKLCQSLGIAIHDRHRAYGDARATVTLFERILAADHEGYVQQYLKKGSKEQRLPSQVPLNQFEKLPERPGVYFFRDGQGKLIYVGKAINIRKRVYSHFTGNNISQRRQLFINDIRQIDYEETGTELMALLKECHYIKQHWPQYNRALKQYEPKFGLIDYVDHSGFIRLCICRLAAGSRALSYFDNVTEATQCLLGLINRFKLDSRLCVFYRNPKNTEAVNVTLNAAVRNEIQAEEHNSQVEEAIASLKSQVFSFVVMDKGRNEEEKSYIYYKENKVYALGYLPKDETVRDIEDFVKQEDRCHSNFYMCQLVRKYAVSHPQQIKVLTGQLC